MTRRTLRGDVGQLLRSVRERRGWSQARLAARVGTSQQHLSKVERGAANVTLADLERLFAGLGRDLRVEAIPHGEGLREALDLRLDQSESDRLVEVAGFGYLLGRFEELPHLVEGRLAAAAHGLPVAVPRLDLLVPATQRAQLGEVIGRSNAVRWSDRWQAFCDDRPAHQPGPMRWRIGAGWEVRVRLVDQLPPAVVIRLGDDLLRVPPLPWLAAHDPDLADVLARLTRAGWAVPAPTASPGAE